MGELSRVTVVGDRGRVDVALPAATPIGEYVVRLARMCGQDRDPMMPPAWSLAVAGDPPMPLGASLSDFGIGDGQVLYLRDTAREPAEAPMVEDLDELVADETVVIRRQMMRYGPAVLGLGLVWLVAGAIWLALAAPGARSAIGLVLTGLLLVALAWSLGQRGSAVPRVLRLAVALTSVLCLAVAGEMTGTVLGGPAGRWSGLLGGATLAALIALAAIADVVIAVVTIHLAGAAGLLALVEYAGATRVQAATCAVLASLGLVALARRVAAMMSAWPSRMMRTRPGAATAAAGMVHESGGVLALLLVAPSATLAVTLPMLATSGNLFALALAAIVAAGLVARARLAGFSSELCILAGAGLAGLFGVLVGAVTMMKVSDAVATTAFLGVALGIVGSGVALSLYGPADPTVPSTTKAPRRRTRAEVLAAVCSIATTPVAMGVFGVFSRLIGFGRHLF
jgi:WXG100 protein secretion system (Wss), protein YukD